MTKFFLCLLVGVGAFFSSCNESSIIGLDVQPPNDRLNVGIQDTTTLVTKTVKEDSLRTDETVIVTQTSLLGKYIDPIFGEATASVYTQVALSTNIAANAFGNNPVCDSIVLSLVYDPAYYGKKDRKQQKLDVYEVTETIPNGTKYSNKTLTTNATTILPTGYNFIPQPSDSVMVYGLKLKPQLRVPLDISFGNKLLTDGNTGTSLANGTAFLNYFKGIYVTTENTAGLASGEGNIMNFRLGESKITLYYHNDNQDSLKYDFGLNNVARFTRFTHTFPSTGALADQLNGTSPAQNNEVFIQSMSGVKTKIEMPSLMNWKDSGSVSINKAELVIKVDPNVLYELDTFAAPAALILFGIDDNGKNFLIQDGFEGSNYFGGTYNAATKEYRFNIARYIQQVLNGKFANNGLHLLAQNGAINANRVVIGGGKNTSAYQMKLNITYTKLH